MKNFTKIIVTTFFIAFLASCSKDKDASPSPASVVGKWNLSSIGIKTDSKTTEATLAEIKKLDADTATELESIFEFKSDGTYSSTSDGTTETGKYVLSSDNKTITTTSSAKEVFNYELISVSNSELQLGVVKSTKKDAMGDFVFANDDEELAAYIFALIVYTVRGVDPDTEFEKAKSVQVTIKLKK